MAAVKVRLHSVIRRTFRVEQVAGMFDLPVGRAIEHSLAAEVPGLDEGWMIGAVVGPSGSGKTTLARVAFGYEGFAESDWPRDRALIDCFDGFSAADRSTQQDVYSKDGVGTGRRPVAPGDGTRSVPATYSIKDLVRVLTGIGLGSVPTWLKPYSVLSAGEQFRAMLAYGLLAQPDVLVCDEFTGALDRTIAKTTSAAVARLLRSKALKLPRLVAVMCHQDVLPWLAPDWVLDLGDDEGPRLSWPRWSGPKLGLTVRRVPQAMWGRFARHHYLSGGLANSATCYGGWVEELQIADCGWGIGGSPVGFCAVVATLGWKRTKHITRLVIRPEFQGLGLGGRLLAAVAAVENAKGNRVTITATHPAIVNHCLGSLQWRLLSVKKAGSTRQRFEGREIRSSRGRAVAGFEWMG